MRFNPVADWRQPLRAAAANPGSGSGSGRSLCWCGRAASRRSVVPVVTPPSCTSHRQE